MTTALEAALDELAAAASCYLQCSVLSDAADRRRCQEHLARAITKARTVPRPADG